VNARPVGPGAPAAPSPAAPGEFAEDSPPRARPGAARAGLALIVAVIVAFAQTCFVRAILPAR